MKKMVEKDTDAEDRLWERRHGGRSEAGWENWQLRVLVDALKFNFLYFHYPFSTRWT